MQENSLNHRLFKFLVGFWIVVSIPLSIALIQVVAALPRKGFPANLYDTILGWFFLPGLNLIVTVSTFAFLFCITIVTGVLSLRQRYSTSNRALRKYLRSVVNDNQGLSPKGFAQQSQALISVNIPLDNVFIHLRAVPDRPIYDIPYEQQKLLEQLEVLRQQVDVEAAEHERRIQDLRRIWYSQLGQELTGIQQKQNVTIEEVLQHLSVMKPAAIILGAPGAGKSTTVRWLALQMAHGCLLPWYQRWVNTILHLFSSLSFFSLPSAWSYRFPEALSPAQIPVLLRISEYAKCPDVENLSFEEFFKDQLGKVDSGLAQRLLAEMDKGNCVLLFDGLDEVASDSLRRRVAESIYTFISNHSIEEKQDAQHYNRFIVSSRIVGYEAGTFSKYAHYTLLELEDEQIQQFLTNWCPAVEHYQAMFAQGMKPLTTQQEQQAQKAGLEQKERLLHALEHNPGIKRLAVNPLMLTILALIQRSGKTLPQRRIDLYEVVTRTLLDNWNQESGRKILPSGEIQLAERLLSSLAYHIHRSDPLITEREVRRITCETMADFYKRAANDSEAQQFIDTLRSSSGLFVESGQGLYSFMHRTFQEYYVALYLLDKKHFSPDKLKQFVATHYCDPIWREPLLLLMAYKSGQRDRDEQQQANELIQEIVDTKDSYDAFLHRSLLFTASSIVDCGAWSITPALQQRIANGLFDLYGDSFGAGRYTQLQKDIEEVTLQWLRGQPQESIQHTSWPPLLEVWRTALYDTTHPIRQEGATHLLASLAPDLASCPQSVLSALVPPLLQLADLQDLPYPQEMSQYFPRPAARPASQNVEDYAFVALRLLEAAGPAGWLHKIWLKWSVEQPELLEHLTQHSLELDYLLTPAAFPSQRDNPNWDVQLNISNEWQKLAQRDPRHLQVQLLQASDSARYPHAYLLWKLLQREERDALKGNAWREVWNTLLQEEMAHGRSATYQTCLNLRLLLAKGNEQQRKEIADEIIQSLSRSERGQIQVLILIINHYPRDPPDLPDLRIQSDLRTLPDLRNLRKLRDLLDLLDLLDLGDLRIQSDLRVLRDLRFIVNQHIQPDLHVLRDLGVLRDPEYIIGILCNILKQGATTSISAVLLALYGILTNYLPIPPQIVQQVQQSLQRFTRQAQQTQQLPAEQRQLVEVLLRQIGVSSTTTRSTPRPIPIRGMPDQWAAALHALKQQRSLTKQQTQWILLGCIDTRRLTKEKRKEVDNAYSVQQVAWELLSQQFNLDNESIFIVMQALDDDHAIVCASAALLLRSSRKTLPQSVRNEAGEKIMRILADDELSRRPLDSLDYNIRRLDDVLYETLKVLAE